MPEILVMLKDILIVMDGIESEGIFRKAGLESEMTILREKITNGEPFHSYNPHSIATLMKVRRYIAIYLFIFLFYVLALV